MKSPSRTVRSRAGFTLIELLTVIAIIGILAAIIIPTVGAVREKAKQAKCASNIRQWGMAMIAYASENKAGQYPIMERIKMQDGADMNVWWFQFTNPTLYGNYLTKVSVGLGLCESQETNGGSSLEQVGYLMTRPSLEIGGAPITTTNMVPLRKVRNPSQFVMMTERAFGADLRPVLGTDYEDAQVTSSNGRANAQAFTRHSGKMNTVWGDGHTSRTSYAGDATSSWNERGDGSNYNFRRWVAVNN